MRSRAVGGVRGDAERARQHEAVDGGHVEPAQRRRGAVERGVVEEADQQRDVAGAPDRRGRRRAGSVEGVGEGRGVVAGPRVDREAEGRQAPGQRRPHLGVDAEHDAVRRVDLQPWRARVGEVHHRPARRRVVAAAALGLVGEGGLVAVVPVRDQQRAAGEDGLDLLVPGDHAPAGGAACPGRP